jgi:hypothetical protein
VGAQPDLRLTWSFLSAIAELWSAHPGTYKVADEADDLIPALAQMSIKALAAEVRESVPLAAQTERIEGELMSPDGVASPVTVRDVTNKVVHGSPERVVVEDGDIRLYFVNSANEVHTSRWTELWFSAPSFIGVMHRLLYVRPHDSEPRDEAVRALILELGPDRFLPSRVAGGG